MRTQLTAQARTAPALRTQNASNSWQTVVDLLQYRAQHHPENTAYSFLKNGENEASRLSYGELALKAQAYAAHLSAHGLAGGRALLLFPPGLEFIAALFGCLYAGVTAIPAYPPRNARGLPRIQAIVEDAQASAVLCQGASVTKIQTLLSAAIDTHALRYIATDTIATDEALQWETPPSDRDALALLQYTSGSTGSPKGVMVSHGNILSNLQIIQAAFELSEEDVGLGWLPLFHDMGLIGHVLQPIYAGIPSILMSPAAFLQKPIRWLRAIAEHGVTVSGGPNFAYELCLRKIPAEERKGLDLSRWRVAYSGAEPIRASTLDDFAAAFAGSGFRRDAFLPCYGLAEATLMVSGGPAHRPPQVSTLDGCDLGQHHVEATLGSAPNARELVYCGQRNPGQLRGQRVVIADPESRLQCDAETVGEIWVAGPHVAQGYWRQPEETARTFDAYLANSRQGPFLRTGDLGFLRNGELVVTGRLKDLIIINGRNLYPQDIEWEAQHSHPSVSLAAAAAFSVTVEGQERLIVAQELALREKPDLDEVLASIRQAVARKHEVAIYEVILLKAGGLPKTSSGKIKRHAARAQYLQAELPVLKSWCLQSEPTPPPANTATPERAPVAESTARAPSKANIAEWLVGQVAAELHVEPSEIDVEQPFTYYGLASVEGVALVGKLENWLGRSVPLSLFWDCPTIDDVSAYLSQGPN